MLTALLVAIFVPSLAFVVAYSITLPWYRSWEGRALMGSATAWTMLTAGFLVQELSPFSLATWAWWVVAALASVAAWLKLALLIHALRTAD